jgi:hypothetical protein
MIGSLISQNSLDPVVKEMELILNSPSKINQIQYKNILRFSYNYNNKNEIETIINFTLLNDKIFGSSKLSNFGEIDIFNSKGNLDLYWNSKGLSQKIKIKFIISQLLMESMDSSNFDNFETILKNEYLEIVHNHLLKSLYYSNLKNNPIYDNLFNSIFYYENKNPNYPYISITSSNSNLNEINNFYIKNSTNPNEQIKLKELKKILDNYDDTNVKNYYFNLFNSNIALMNNGKKILIQNFDINNKSHGKHLDRNTFESLFAGIKIEYIDEETNSIIGTVSTDPSEELFHALFNDEEKRNKILVCLWN